MSKFISTFYEVIVFASLIGVMAGLLVDAAANLSGASAIIVGLVTLFVTLGFITYINKKLGMSGK